MADTSSQDNEGLVSSSDYKLASLILVGSDGTSTDIKGLILELDIYESIFEATMTGSVRIGEALDLVSNLHMHGNEFLIMSIDKPTLGMPMNKTFRIYKISDRSIDANALQNYTIFFCSEELYLSTQVLLSKSYKGMRVDQMVSDILLNRLQTPSSKVKQIEQTAGNFDLIIPRMNPLEAVQWLRPRAYNSNKNLFFFFENRDGFNFVSYETLISTTPYTTYTRSMKLEQDPSKNMTGVNFMMPIEDFDLIKAMRYGSYSSTIIIYDFLNRAFTNFNFTSQNVPASGTLNGNLAFNNMKNRLGFTMASSGETMLKFALSTDSDPTANPMNIKKWLVQDANRLGQLHTFKLVITVPGDVLLKSGMVVNFTMPNMTPQDKQISNNQMRSGKYLVASVHHRFVQDTYTSIVQLLSDSSAIELPGSPQGSTDLTKILNS